MQRAWPGIRSLAIIESRREFTSGERQGEAGTEWRYYISSCELDAAQFNQAIRQHWSIENGCHWVLDVNFREDLSRIRAGHGPENFAILRRMTLNLINQNTTIKSSKKSKRKLAAWSTTRLQELLGLQAYPQASKAADS